MNIDAILALILGSTGTGVVGYLFKYMAQRRRGKLEDEESLIARINKQSAADTARVKVAEDRADKADRETEIWRQRFLISEERGAYYRRYMRENGLKIPKWPPDDYDNPHLIGG